ncbi:MAG: DUF4990 domain-containing protein [Bacteroidales bacterium]|nr:DUF4990 domain-containing protein [Bacteroidales bacterium]
MKQILLCLVITLSSIASAKTYYVAPQGNDSNPGSMSLPWLTWAKAFHTAQAGDTVYFRGGVYNTTVLDGTGIKYNPSDGYGYNGERDNPIVFMAYPSDFSAANYPILDCSNVTSNPLLNQGYTYAIDARHINNVKFIGLTIRNVFQLHSQACVGDAFSIWNSNNITVERCTMYDIGGGAFGCGYSDTITFLNCDAYRCCDTLSGAPGNYAQGFSVGAGGINDTIGYSTVKGCRAWQCSDQGFVSGGGNAVIVFEDCWSFNNGAYTGSGHGFKLGYLSVDVGPSKRILKKCLAFSNANHVWNGTTYTADGFTTNDNNGLGANQYFYNCVAYNNGRYGFVTYATTNDPERHFANNISFQSGSEDFRYYPYGEQPTTNLTNSWNSRVTVNAYDFISLDTTGVTGPRQPDGSLPDLDFLKLATTSDLIDAGTDVGVDYNGIAPDLGWSETSSSSTTLPASPVYIGSVIQNATPSTIEITYNLTLANILPATSAFTVDVNNVSRSISSIAVSGTKVLLTLASPIIYGDEVTLDYAKPASNPIQTPSGGKAESLTSVPVTNNCIVAVANLPPVISIVTPTKSTSFIAPATITIEAVASDPDGTISLVEYFNGTVKLGERTFAPFSFTWKEVPEGTYTITAAATDNKNLRSASPAVTVIVEKSSNSINQLPTVNIISPGNHKKYKKNDKIVIIANASDPDGSISKVEFKNRDITLAEVTTAPYIYTWEASDTGTYVITAFATDNLGATSSSSDLELIIGLPDVVHPEIINIYPNPNDGHFRLELLDSLPEKDNRIAIVSMTGKIVHNDIIKNVENYKEFDLSSLTPGTYALMITTGNSLLTATMFIKR